MTTEVLKDHHLIWQKKDVLREIYHDFYQRITKHLQPGNTLEIGGGTGNLKNYLKNVISTDIIKTSWLDITCDAQQVPFKDRSFDNIVGMDVLHHIERPIRFLQEASRILKKNGRIVLLEPAITKMSWFFYHFLHEEPVVLSQDPLEEGPLDPNRSPFDANQAIPELLFGRFSKAFHNEFPELTLEKKEYLSLWCYPLSGGFKRWSLIPKVLTRPLLGFEKKVERFLGRHIGFRMLVVIEKRAINV